MNEPIKGNSYLQTIISFSITTRQTLKKYKHSEFVIPNILINKKKFRKHS